MGSAINQEEDGDHCLNPFVQDAQSWACDCFDEMRSACAGLASEAINATLYTDELCMRAKFANILASVLHGKSWRATMTKYSICKLCLQALKLVQVDCWHLGEPRYAVAQVGVTETQAKPKLSIVRL